MKAFWLALLERAGSALLVAALPARDWRNIQDEVEMLLDAEIPGEEKRRKVFARLRRSGSQAATWLLYAAIEVAYGRLKDLGDQKDRTADNLLCPTCGYYCLGRGGRGCIDKPTWVKRL